jgi:hypothetical protein
LVATARLRREPRAHETLAAAYEAKFLVQLFRYEEAVAALEGVPDSKEKRSITFNIMLNLAEDDRAAELAMGVFADVSRATGTEHDYLVLRNAVHLFPPAEARAMADAAVDGFGALGRRFGAATARNNLGIVELAAGATDLARDAFELARLELDELGSTEVYQPLVNLSAVALLAGDLDAARGYLAAGRVAAPRSLQQDGAMFDLDGVTVDLCNGTCSIDDASARMRPVVDAARKTRDLRFLAVAEWFAASLDSLVGGRPVVPATADVIERLRSDGRVPLERFLPVAVDGMPFEAPFVLSPHWRY